MDFDKVLFEGEFDPTEIRKGIDDMIDGFRKAQAQGDLSNTTLAKMQGAIDGVTAATQELQTVSGKTSIAGALGDGALVPKIAAIRDKVEEVGKTITSTVDKAKSKLAELKKSQDSYKDTIKATADAIKQNEKEIDALTKKLTALNTSEKAGATAARDLKKEIDGIRAGNIQYGQQLGTLRKGLDETTSAMKVQSTQLKAAESAGNGFAKGLGTVFGGLRKIAYLIPGIGLAGLIGLIAGPVIDAFSSWWDMLNKTSDALKLLKVNQANLNEVMANTDKSAGKQITDLKILYQAAADVNIPMAERLRAVKALQEEFPEYFKNIKAETILNGDAKASYDALSLSILSTARATASKAKLDDIEAQRLDVAFQRQKVINATTNEINSAKATIGTAAQVVGGLGVTAGSQGISAQQVKDAAKRRQELALADIDAKDKSLKAQEDFLIKYAGLANIAKTIEDKDDKKFKEKKAKKEIEDDFIARRNALQVELAKFAELEFQDEKTIRALYAEKLKKALDDIKKDKGLKPGERSQLNDLATDLNKRELTKALDDNVTQRKAYQEKLNNDLESLEQEAAIKRISNIQNDFERQKQTIIAEGDKLITAKEVLLQKGIAGILKSNLLSPEEKQKAINDLKRDVDDFVSQVKIHTAEQLQQLSFDTFEKMSEDAKRLLGAGNLGVSQGSVINIKALTDQFLAGKISYQKYQDGLTDIARFAANERFQLEKLFLEKEIKSRQDKLATDTTLTKDQITKLKDEIQSLQQQLADATGANATTTASNKNTDTNKRINEIVEYVSAIGNLAQSVIGFWQKANEAEQAALERSIAIQDRRVEAARNIAAKGNAEYLRLEEERQQALLIKQENAARRTLAINAALQASQVIVALVSSIAEGAKVGGALGAIIDVAAVVGAIASAYAIAQSFKPVTPSFFVGTEDTGTGGHADGKGGFHAVLHPHERVVTADQNRKLKGVSNEDLVRSVEQHRVMAENWATPRAPELNLAAMDMANNVVATEHIRLAAIMEENNNELKENNQLQRQSIKILKAMGMSVNMDKHGLAVSFMQTVEEMNKAKKS